MAEYRLSSRASANIVDIFEFSIDYFGLNQAARYRDDLMRCFELLAENPKMGRPAPRLGPGVRRHEYGGHVILYREEAGGILVLALVHGRSVRGLEL